MREPTLTENQELALLGHAANDERVYGAIVELGVTLSSTYVDALWRRMVSFHSMFRRHPSVDELRDTYQAEDPAGRAAFSKNLDKALALAKTIRIETVQPTLLWIAERGAIRTELDETIRLFNKSMELFEQQGGGNAGAKEHQEAIAHVRKLSMDLDRLQNAVGGARFEDMGTRVSGESNDREARAGRIIPTGIQYLDEASGGGVAPQDTWCISAPTGAGKTESMLSIASNAAELGFKVSFFALEAEVNEIERRRKFTKLLQKYNTANPGNSDFFDQAAWRNGSALETSRLKQFEEEVEAEMRDKYKNIRTFYIGYGKYGVRQLESDILACSKESDLIVIDHLGYVALDGDNENKEVQDLMFMIRDLSKLGKGTPIVTAAHVRKSVSGQRRFTPLLMDRDDIRGSASISQCATHVVLIGKVHGIDVKTTDGNDVSSPTLVRLGKFRHADRDRFTALCLFDPKKGSYFKNYALGRLTKGDTRWEQLTPVKTPRWARSATINVAPIEQETKK